MPRQTVRVFKCIARFSLRSKTGNAFGHCRETAVSLVRFREPKTSSRPRYNHLVLNCAEIIDTDQGSHFTSFAWTDTLQRAGSRISMDRKGRCLDNVFVERLWRSLKYECVYLHTWETG